MNFSNIKDWSIPEGSVKQVTDSLGRVIWEKSGGHDYSQDYFFIEDISGQPNTVSIKKSASDSPTVTVYKSTDQTNWSSMGNTSTTAITATVPANGRLYLKATANTWGIYAINSNNYFNYIRTDNSCNVGGNIMSLLYGDNFRGQTALSNNNTYAIFCQLLFGNTNLVSATNLILPTTTLTRRCYYGMFMNCTALTTAPALPATTMAERCYDNMFYQCTSLTQTPELPATTLAERCYYGMFDRCTNLVYIPTTLPVMTLAEGCYQNMFQRCTSITYTPTLPATTLADYCYVYMFSGCTSLTQAPTLPATTLAYSCYGNMYSGCTNLVYAPELPITTLAPYCYNSMFEYCTSLTTAPVLPATTLAIYCYSRMFYGCTSLLYPPELKATVLVNNCYNNMFSGCTSLNIMYVYADDISATNCTVNWLQNVAGTGDFYNLGTATYPSGVRGIPTGWTEHTTL